MRDVAHKRDEAPLWEAWAEAAFNLAFNLTHDLGSRDPAAALALLDDMRDVAHKRDEAPLWENWAKAALTLTHDLQSRDPVAARTLLAEVLALPPAIRQRLARAVDK